MDGQLLPAQRTCEVLSDVFGYELSEGTLYNVSAQCFERLAPVEAQIRAAIEAADVIHCDETGLADESQTVVATCRFNRAAHLLLCASQTGPRSD